MCYAQFEPSFVKVVLILKTKVDQHQMDAISERRMLEKSDSTIKGLVLKT